LCGPCIGWHKAQCFGPSSSWDTTGTPPDAPCPCLGRAHFSTFSLMAAFCKKQRLWRSVACLRIEVVNGEKKQKHLVLATRLLLLLLLQAINESENMSHTEHCWKCSYTKIAAMSCWILVLFVWDCSVGMEVFPITRSWIVLLAT
jgi:hypothetical protein